MISGTSYWVSTEWSPSTENINALPEVLRKYVAELETIADPAGMVSRNFFLEEHLSSSQAENAALKQQLSAAHLTEKST